MRQEHPSAAIPTEPQLVQHLSHFHVFPRLAVLVTLANQHAELLPFVGDGLAAAEATHWNDHYYTHFQMKPNLE